MCVCVLCACMWTYVCSVCVYACVLCVCVFVCGMCACSHACLYMWSWRSRLVIFLPFSIFILRQWLPLNSELCAWLDWLTRQFWRSVCHLLDWCGVKIPCLVLHGSRVAKFKTCLAGRYFVSGAMASLHGGWSRMPACGQEVSSHSSQNAEWNSDSRFTGPMHPPNWAFSLSVFLGCGFCLTNP